MTPNQRMTLSRSGFDWMILPSPPVPTMMRRASEIAQTKTTRVTWLRSSPCLMTKAFWAPIATMRDKPVKKPVMSAITP